MDPFRRLSLGIMRSRPFLASSKCWSSSYPGGRIRRIKRVALGMSGGVDSTGKIYDGHLFKSMA